MRTKTSRTEAIRKVCAGLTKYPPKGAVLLAGRTFTPAGLQKFLQGDIDDNDASTQAKARWLQAVKTAQGTAAKVDRVLRAIEAMVASQHGEAQDAETVLADFGYAPRRKAVRTVAAKAAAVAKAAATREGRQAIGTSGTPPSSG